MCPRNSSEASFGYGVFESGLTLGSAGGLVVASFGLGYAGGTLINKYVLPEKAKESIGNGELRVLEFFGYKP